jgi:hypothetical protein
MYIIKQKNQYVIIEADMSKTYTPPSSASKEAKRGLEIRKSLPKSKQCCTPTGLKRANDLANRTPMSLETIFRMYKFFERHEKNKSGGKEDKGYQAWLIWGGDSGRAWAKKILKKEGVI